MASSSAARGGTPAAAGKDGVQKCKIFIGGLPTGLTSDQLRAAFLRFGDIKESQVLANRDTGRSRGFGFVVFADVASVKRTIDACTVDDSTGQFFHKIGNKVVEVKRAASRDEMRERASGGDAPAPTPAPVPVPAPAPKPAPPSKLAPPTMAPKKSPTLPAAPQARSVAGSGVWSLALPPAVTRAPTSATLQRRPEGSATAAGGGGAGGGPAAAASAPPPPPLTSRIAPLGWQ